jgi:NAD(P)-dependent dehydrogenase (short-subunit alcohol dehydrogenase family)
MSKGNILVTGASSGIGRGCALRFAEIGYHTFGGVRRAEDGAALAAESGGKVKPVILDVASAESIAAAMSVIGGRPLAGLVNNAGISMVGPVELVPVETWRRQMEVNVIGLVAVTQACLPLLREGRGRIVNIGSVAGRGALPGTGAYDASKSAVAAVTDALRMELAPWRISVSLIEAGNVATPIWEKSLREAEEVALRAGPERAAAYVGLMKALREESSQAARKASPVAEIVRAVEHAMTAWRPRTRYLVGKDAWLWAFLAWLPDRWRDWLILSQMRE